MPENILIRKVFFLFVAIPQDTFINTDSDGYKDKYVTDLMCMFLF